MADVVRIMTEAKVDAIPVVRGLHLLGLVTSSDLLHLLVEREHEEARRPLPFDFRLIEDPRALA